MNAERWLPVVGFEGLYEVSDEGRIRSVARNAVSRWGSPKRVQERILVQSPNPRGYMRISLNKDGVRTCHFVHRLIMAAFVGPRPDDMEVAHNDGIPDRNCLSNLRYATHIENMSDIKIHGTAPEQRGEKGPGAKLTVNEVQMIRDLVAQGNSHGDVAVRFGISRPNVSMIAARRTWGHI